MKKALFITYNDLGNTLSGGTQCSRRNLGMVSKFFDTDTYVVRNTKIDKAFSFLRIFFPPITYKDKKKITTLIQTKNYDLIFFDSSLFGVIIKSLGVEFHHKIISYFHNVEYDYISVRFGKNIIKYPYLLVGYLNEKWTLKYSRVPIVLSERDKNRISDLYKSTVNAIIPITFEDLFVLPSNENKIVENEYLLFVGSLNRSNFEAVNWFINNIMPKITGVNLLIVGKNFENVKESLERTNVIVVGTTNLLDRYYHSAKAVVSPIIHGAGMKVKIAEALMFGKTIFGSQEAFEGYITDVENSTIICNTELEYIEKINAFIKSKRGNFNPESRELFEKNYSFDKSVTEFGKIIN